jgi:hypothetical protein
MKKKLSQRMGQLFLFFTTLTVQFSTTTPQSIGLQTVGIKKFQVVTALAFFLSFCFGNAESFRHENHLPKRWLAHSLKTQEILAKKWALLRTSPNGLWAVFAGFLCVFKFTGSAAPRLGGLARLL